MRNVVYHQLQGLYTAGDVMCAVDCVRALPECRSVVFVNHDNGFDDRVYRVLTGLGAEVRRAAVVTETDIVPDLVAVFYHCVGYDDSRRGSYVSFRGEPPGVRLCAWIHTPGLCGSLAERYAFLRDRRLSTIIFDSSFSFHNTPGIDLAEFATRAIINPCVDAEHYAAIERVPDGVFRVGRWSRGDDTKYSDDFLDLLASVDGPNTEFLCMGIPGKFRGATMPSNVRFVENGEMAVEGVLAQLDALIFKTDAASWHEGWCRTVTEAMAAGVVPVVENRGGLVDQVRDGHSGFLCNSNADFKFAVERLRSDADLRAQMSRNAKRFASHNLGLAQLREDLLRLIDPPPARRLNLGFDVDIREDYFNAGAVPIAGLDMLVDLDPYFPRLPFSDDEFDEILAFHVLEHVANKNMIVEELWRIARNNASIKIKVPDRNHSDAYVDPTHFSYWEVDTIDFYLPGHVRSHFSPAKFGLVGKYSSGREIGWELLALRCGPGSDDDPLSAHRRSM